VALVVYNTLTRREEEFSPIDPSNVRMYVCGPTVYDLAHIGNARPVVVFDLLYRLLKRRHPRVTYVRNITDVEDKINAAARANRESIRALTERTAEAFHEDMAALNALPPDHEPRATEHIADMIAMIQTLIASDHAYVAEGHVLFSVPSMPEYGALSRRNRDELVAGARVEVAPYKRDAADFVLWKPSAEEDPGWESPWGRGRPGWHIECSAMSEAHLGETFDIHGGGLDLIFPHHENEIAQSVCAHGGRQFVRYWMHNGYVMVNGEKMSKSLGNFFTVRELLDEAPGEAIRLALLSAHYRQPLDFTRELLAQSKQTLDRFYLALRSAPVEEAAEPDPDLIARVESALDQDLNTPQAIAELHEITTRLNKAKVGEKAPLRATLVVGGALLGLLESDPETWLKGGERPDGLTDGEIEEMIARRVEARKNRDFVTADQIRDELIAQGIHLEDGPGGTSWRRG